jgi:alkylation response protein AidB-like acyl-CoA dehydrogenase
MPCASATLSLPPTLVNGLIAGRANLAAAPLQQRAPAATLGGYQRYRLRRETDLEVTAACWREGGTSSLHGHDGCAALYTVQSGAIEEERYLPDGDGYRCEVAVLRAGDQSFLPPGAFHRIRALEETVTVHAYSPAPQTTTSGIAPETQRLLDRARAALIAPPNDQPHKPAAGECGSAKLAAVVGELLDGWAERETQANRDGALRMPATTLAEMRSSGILAAPMPARFGGWDAPLAEVVAAVRQIAQRAPATALALVMPLGNAATTRIPLEFVPRPLRSALRQGQCWIATQVKRGRILAVANSEPGSGGELAQTKTTANRGEDGDFRLTGRKSFATFRRDADYFLCAARRCQPGGPDVIDGFFVARDAAGLIIDDRWNPVGMRPTASVGLTLEHTPAEALLGHPGCLEGVNARHWSTVLFAAVFLGIGEGALREGVRHTPADATWARGTMAELALNLEAAAGFVEMVARGERWPLAAGYAERTRRAKTFVARTAVETAVQAAMISGGRSYTPDHPVFRFLCDALAGPLLRPPLPRAMDAIVQQLFPGACAAA